MVQNIRIKTYDHQNSNSSNDLHQHKSDEYDNASIIIIQNHHVHSYEISLSAQRVLLLYTV